MKNKQKYFGFSLSKNTEKSISVDNFFKHKSSFSDYIFLTCGQTSIKMYGIIVLSTASYNKNANSIIHNIYIDVKQSPLNHYSQNKAMSYISHILGKTPLKYVHSSPSFNVNFYNMISFDNVMFQKKSWCLMVPKRGTRSIRLYKINKVNKWSIL